MAIVGEPVSPETVLPAGMATAAEPGAGNGPGSHPPGQRGQPRQPGRSGQARPPLRSTPAEAEAATRADAAPPAGPATVDNESPAFAAAWHPVADAAELRDQPLSVMLLGQAWVLVRLDGEVVAFEDSCPHRRAPLSAGWVEDGRLRCRYHGWSFDDGGRATLIPTNGPGAPIPARACLRRPAGVVERYGLVWLAPEPPVCDLHPFPEWDDPGFDRSWTPPRRTPAGAAQLADEVLGASPLPPFTTSPGAALLSTDVVPSPVERHGWEVRAVHESPYPHHPDPPIRTSQRPRVQPHVLTKTGRPAAAVRLTLDFPLTGDRLAVLFACQPETRQSTRIYKLMARSGYDGDPDRRAELVRYETVVLKEDPALLDRHRGHSLPVDLPAEVPTRAGRLSGAYRRLLGDLVDHHTAPRAQPVRVRRAGPRPPI